MRPIVTVFVIATKNYVHYVTQLISSIPNLGNRDFVFQFILLTDDVAAAARINPSEHDDYISIFEIESLGWPEATLYRFELMTKHWSAVNGSIVMYMDADTEFVANFSYSDLLTAVESSASGMVLVRHPGYFKRFFLWKPVFKSRIGPWERKRASLAFVPIIRRGHYVCGGVYWGLSDSFLRMSTQLAQNISTDESNFVRAKHNDESHLNWWLSQNSSSTVTPAWAFASGYRNLKTLTPIIEVVHKPDSFERIPT